MGNARNRIISRFKSGLSTADAALFNRRAEGAEKNGALRYGLSRILSVSEFDDTAQNDRQKGRRHLSSFRRPREVEVLIAGVEADVSIHF
jgi:hypothetical protein